jgi:sporulation protein YlmC with PRC-barrel domain
MGEVTTFEIGAEASCSDGPCGKVIRVVVDPVARAVTHVVVEPTHREGLGRLVPLDLVGAAPEGATDGLTLRCTLAEFDELDHAEESHFLPGSGIYAGYAESQVFALPYYGLGLGNITPPIVTDTLPLGEVGVRRGESVHATDGEIGRVQGLVIEPEHHHVTHVLLQEGHLWGRKDVAIPIVAVTGIEGGIQLSLTKQEIQDLPAIDLADPESRPGS